MISFSTFIEMFVSELINWRHILSILKDLLCSSYFSRVWAVCVLWITYDHLCPDVLKVGIFKITCIFITPLYIWIFKCTGMIGHKNNEPTSNRKNYPIHFGRIQSPRNEKKIFNNGQKFFGNLINVLVNHLYLVVFSSSTFLYLCYILKLII